MLAISGCSDGPPPRTVAEFLDDPIGLEATLSRCNADRSLTRDDPECINAREANNRMAAEDQRRLERDLERESQRKLDAIRRRNESAAIAARQAEEAAKAREEALYEQQFEIVPETERAPEDSSRSQPDSGPMEPAETSVVPENPADEGAPEPVSDRPSEETLDSQAESDPSDLESLRQEMNRRNQQSEASPEQ